MTTFLQEAGAPLDNNLCERALKRAVLHRKNTLFYRTLHGAEVGDLFMTLIHTCQLCGANSFDYLTELQRHAQELTANRAAWMPWNYRHRWSRLAYDESCLAEKDRSQPGSKEALKVAAKRALPKSTSDMVFGQPQGLH